MPNDAHSTSRARAALLLSGLLLLLSSACATSISIPEVSDLDRSSIELEIGAPSQAELDRQSSIRFWEVFLSDESVQADFTDEQREALRTASIHDAAEAVHASFEKDSGLQAVELMRADPSFLRSVADQSAGNDATSLREAADGIDLLQSVVHRRIQAIGERVVRASPRPSLLVHPEPAMGFNAGAPVRFGSNEVYVGTELAVGATTDDELACAVGHEIGHVTEGHTTAGAWVELGKNVLQTTAAIAAASAMAYANDGAPLTNSQLEAAMSLGQLTRFALADVPLRMTGWERRQELEADAVGLYYVWQAGYDPDACADLMVRIARHERASGGVEGFRWWNIHPPSADRVVILRKLAEQAKAGTLQRRE